MHRRGPAFWLLTGFFALFSQPRARHPSHQRSRKQLTT